MTVGDALCLAVEAARKSIADQVQANAMLEQRLEAGQDERKAFRGSDGLIHLLVRAAAETRIRDADERGVVLAIGKSPFHGRRLALAGPLDEDPPIWFDGFDVHRNRHAVHLPVPLHWLTR